MINVCATRASRLGEEEASPSTLSRTTPKNEPRRTKRERESRGLSNAARSKRSRGRTRSHELAHNVWGAHDANFWRLYAELKVRSDISLFARSLSLVRSVGKRRALRSARPPPSPLSHLSDLKACPNPIFSNCDLGVPTGALNIPPHAFLTKEKK